MSIFVSSVCESFRVSFIIDSAYHVKVLLYHPRFGSHSQKGAKKNNHPIDLHQDDVGFFSGGLTPIDWDMRCAIFEGTFLAGK